MAAKKIQVELIEREKYPALYQLLDELVHRHHPDLATARIALAWWKGWRPNRDGHLQLAKTRKVGTLDRELHGYDFAILLNAEATQTAEFSNEQRRALLDHELCHCAVAHNADGSVRHDERGRPVWRMRRHDVEEFQAVVARHGLWQKDLEEFAAAAIEKRRQPLLAEAG